MMHTKYNGSKTPTVKIKGKGNFKGTGDYGGTKTLTYKIVVRKALIWQLPGRG